MHTTREEAQRLTEPGDVSSALSKLVDRYESMGDANVRVLEIERRIPAIQYLLSQGRASHRGWVEHVFAPFLPKRQGAARERRVMAFYAAKEVYGRCSVATSASVARKREPYSREWSKRSPVSGPSGSTGAEAMSENQTNASPSNKNFLFAMWEGGGTVPPMLGAARRLVERGHRVRVLGDPTIREEAEHVGCSFSPWRTAPHRTDLRPESDLLKDWETTNPLSMLKRFRDLFIVNPAPTYAADTLVVLEQAKIRGLDARLRTA